MNGSTTSQSALLRLRLYRPSYGARYDLDTFARLSDLHPCVIEEYIELGLIDPVETGDEREWLFDDDTLHLVRKIERLRRDLGVNLSGVGVILDLLRQIDELERELERLRRIVP